MNINKNNYFGNMPIIHAQKNQTEKFYYADFLNFLRKLRKCPLDFKSFPAFLSFYTFKLSAIPRKTGTIFQ